MLESPFADSFRLPSQIFNFFQNDGAIKIFNADAVPPNDGKLVVVKINHLLRFADNGGNVAGNKIFTFAQTDD